MNRPYRWLKGPAAFAASWIALFACGSCAAPAEPQTLELVQTIPLKGPDGRLDHLALDARHGRLFVANMANSSLDVVDLKAGKLLQQIPGQHKIQGIAYAPDLDRIFVGNGDDDVCNVFDGADYKLQRALKFPDADNVRYNPRTHLVYVAHADKALGVLDARTLEVKSDIKLPGSPEAFQLEAGRPRLYLNTPSPSQVVVIDTDKNEVLTTYPLKLAGANYPMALDEADHRLFVGCRKSPMVVVLDNESGKEITGVPIPGDTDDLFYDARHKRIYVSCGAGFLAVIRQNDADHYEVLEKIPTAKLARTSFFDVETGRLYVVLPRHGGEDGPSVLVYQARP
jgi:DNA-binding beta-propeller fold protein YncE